MIIYDHSRTNQWFHFWPSVTAGRNHHAINSPVDSWSRVELFTGPKTKTRTRNGLGKFRPVPIFFKMTEPYPSGPVAMLSDSDPFRRFCFVFVPKPDDFWDFTDPSRSPRREIHHYAGVFLSNQPGSAAGVMHSLHRLSRPFLPGRALLAPRTKLILSLKHHR